MIRTVTKALDPQSPSDAATVQGLSLLGAQELLVTSPNSHAAVGGGMGIGGDDEAPVALETLAAMRAWPERYRWNVQLPSVDEVQRELEQAAAAATMSLGEGGPSSPVAVVLHAPGATPQDRTPLRRLAEKVEERRVLVVAGVLPPALPLAFTAAEEEAAAVERAGKMLAHHLRFGLPLVARRSQGDGSGGDEEINDESAAVLRDQAQRVGVGFIGMLELLRGAAVDQPLLAAAARASVETGAPIFLTTQDAFGRMPPDVDRVTWAIDTLLALQVPPSSIVVCRLPGAAGLESACLAWLRLGVTLCFSFQGGVFYSLVPDDDNGDGSPEQGGDGPATRDYPSDGEAAALVARLCRQGFAGQLLWSPGVCCRLQLRQYGGHGYGHARRAVAPQLRRRGVGEEDLRKMGHGNVVRLLAWWAPPPPVEREVEMGKCDWCGKAFELRAGEYFTKFAYTYCRGKCLSAHGNTGWKPLSGAAATAADK